MPRKSGIGGRQKTNPHLQKSLCSLGHSSPQHCPSHRPQPNDPDPLGPPLSIQEVAALIGSSVWTVRQKYLPLGLPYFRTGATGKLFFYKHQVIRWLIRQQKGEVT